MADNENDSYSETTTESWGSRIMGSIKGIGTGFILVLVSFYLLWWNEGRAVRVYKALKEGRGAVVEVKSDSVDATNQGKLVYVAGPVTNEGIVKDPEFAVEAAKKLSLRRTVEMYQWQERCTSKTEKKLGGSTETKTECKYEKDWSSSASDSSKFKKRAGHENPAMQYQSKTVVADSAKLGAFKMPQDLTARLNKFVALPIDDKLVALVKTETKKPASKSGEWIFVGADAAKPQVGDYRIKFEVVEPTDASIIAMQQGETFGAYRAQSGESLYMLSAGIVPAQQMFQAAEEGNATTTWILRFVGWLLMLTGFRMILAPLQTLLDVVPFLGSIAGVGISFAAGVVAFALSLVTIALAWLYYRPVLTIILIAIAVGAFVGAKYLKKQAPQKAAA